MMIKLKSYEKGVIREVDSASIVGFKFGRFNSDVHYTVYIITVDSNNPWTSRFDTEEEGLKEIEKIRKAKEWDRVLDSYKFSAKDYPRVDVQEILEKVNATINSDENKI